MPLIGIASPLPPAQAQTEPAPPTKAVPKPLSAENKAKIEKFLAIAQLENLCKTQLDLKVENASIEQVIARIQDNFPTETLRISARGASPVPISFDLKDKSIGDLLLSAAASTKCNLYLLSGGLLIAPASQLTEAERREVTQREGGRWINNVRAGGTGWGVKFKALQSFASVNLKQIGITFRPGKNDSNKGMIGISVNMEPSIF